MQTTLVMKKLLPVDLIAGKEEAKAVLTSSKENTSGKYRKVWLGNYKVLKYDTLEEGRESNRKEVESYNSRTIEWLPELFMVSPNYRVIVVEKVITVNENVDAVYEAAKAKLGAMVDFFMLNPNFGDKGYAWNYGIRLYLYFTMQCLRSGQVNQKDFNTHFNWGFKKHFPNGEDWYSLLTPEIKELALLFEEDVLWDLHWHNIGVSQFNGKFKVLDFGGN